MTSYIQLVQDNIQDCNQVQIFLRNCSVLNFPLFSINIIIRQQVN